MWWWHDNLNAGDWVWMSVTMLAFWGTIAWLIIAVIRGSSDRRDAEESPERVLAQRFARGEIDENEYSERLEALRRHDASHR